MLRVEDQMDRERLQLKSTLVRSAPMFRHCGRILLLLTGLVSIASAQNPTGSLRGVVQDNSSARIPSAEISVESAQSPLTRRIVADERGEFRVDDLPPGPYRIVVNAKGFAQARSDVRVPVSSVREVVVTLAPEAITQTVRVQAQASSITTQDIDASGAVRQTVVTSNDLERMPLAARSFANIAYLAPGTEPVEPSDPTKARITAVSTGGSSGLNNELSVDGGDNSDDYIGGFLQNFSPEAIHEFAVRTALEEADTGRTTAGSVVISTKHGTNDWHGDEAFYERTAPLNARFPIDNPAPNSKQPFSRQNYVGTLGGPIVKDKFWFFSSFEYVHENASIAYSPASQLQFAALAQLASQGLIDIFGTSVTSISVPSSVPVLFRDSLGLLRFDWAQSSRSQWFVRGAVDSYLARNALVQQATLPSTGATTRNNYTNFVISNQFTFGPTWAGTLVLSGSTLHLTQGRNSDLGFALAFPFSSTSSTISGLETFGDNQFVTAITAFPVLRNQEKYQLRYDVTHTTGRHAPRFGVDFIHEPVLSGALTANPEVLVTFPRDPMFYAANPVQFTADLQEGLPAAPPEGGDGNFSQNVQRLGLYAEDSWRVMPGLTMNYGLRYDTTFGLFRASGQSQLANPTFEQLGTAGVTLGTGAPHDYRKAFAPRVGVAYALGGSGDTVLRGGVGLYYNDLAQNGWVTAFQAVNGGSIAHPETAPLALIDPNYHTPYALHATAGIEHAFNRRWMLSGDWVHETGMHGYRRYQYEPGFTIAAAVPAPVVVFRSDNRSSYDALMIRLQGNVSKRATLVANYTLSSAKTWGCVLDELFDYVNGVCNPLNAFAKGDYGPSGEDVPHRFVLAGTFRTPGGFELALLSQAESARPITLTTPVDVNGLGDIGNDRAVINGVQTTLGQFRGTPYLQTDLRVSRPLTFHERWSVTPFAEFFNLFNRNNPGTNYVSNISALPTPVNDLANATAFCVNPSCTETRPISNPNQLLVPAGALGDFFGPGTTVGIPFAAQLGVRVSF
jgi:hypothetical protein